MQYDYVIAGNVMLDRVIFLDGSQSGRENIGGPATFAYSGVRLWTDDVIQCSNVGADWETLFRPWIEKNHINTEGFKIITDRCNHSIIKYKDKSGQYAFDMEVPMTEEEYWLKNDAWQDFGYMKSSPEDIEKFTKGKNIKGVYVAQNADRTFWRKFGEIKKRDGFKLMWEIEGPWAHIHYLNDVREICRDNVDIFSINIEEAQNLFDVEGDEACIKDLQSLDVDMTLFRVGERGLYAVTKEEAVHLFPSPGPIVDPCGCGNTSTGSALYAYCEGKDPVMVGIMANVAASMNIRQYGVIPDFETVRNEAYSLATELYEKYRNRLEI
ncbi:MAG: carbohydrate kinase family protein [Oscillospiraceae bacterium]|nr:carbohydrate kinase family protein [Oscillospiraceae bacterium]